MKIDQLKALDPKRVIVLDTETTGIKPQGNDEILSLTIIDLEGTVLFDELVKPEHRKSWPKAQEVNGITPAMVKDKLPLVAYRDQLQELWQRIDLVVGYNVGFDSDFLYSSGLALSPYVEEFDVMREFAPVNGKWDEYHQDYRWCKLNECAKHYGVKLNNAHTSLGDTEATRQCFIALINDPKYESSQRAFERLKAKNTVKSVVKSEDKTGRRMISFALFFFFIGLITMFRDFGAGMFCLVVCMVLVVLKMQRDKKGK